MFSLEGIIALIAVSVIAVGQIMFKAAARSLDTTNHQSLIDLLNANRTPLAIIGVALLLYACSTVGWIYALRTLPLSIAYMFNALAFVVVPFLSIFLFDESLPRYYTLGVAFIIVGLVLIIQR